MATSERFGPTRRGGPIFRWLGEPLAIDLANTVMVVRDGEDVDLLAEPGDLSLWVEGERERLGAYRVEAGDLEAVTALRDATRALLAAAAAGDPPPAEALDRVNAASAAAPVTPLLAAGGDRLLRVEDADPAGDRVRLLGTLGRAVIELLGDEELPPLRVCTAPSCGMFYLGARRWCCSACGNRARAARHYERRRAAASA